MNWGIIISLVFALLVIGGFFYFYVATYNRFMVLYNAANATMGQIRVALRKRLDLISSLAEAVGSYAKYEKDTLESITRMRASIGAASPEEIIKLERESRNFLARLLAVVEQYPNLRTSELVQNLMNSSKEIEDEIARHRYTYNNIVQQYNTMIDTIPSNFVARLRGLTKLPYLDVGGPEIERRPSLTFYGESRSGQ